jgi:uncharacterized membrane protein
MQKSPKETIGKDGLEEVKSRNRHGCLTAWLLLIICVSIIFIVLYLARASYPQSTPDLPWWAIPLLVMAEIFEIVCSIALLKWKKWGFWGLCTISMITFVINISLGVVVTSLSGLVGIAILYALLNLGGKNKGWTQLN